MRMGAAAQFKSSRAERPRRYLTAALVLGLTALATTTFTATLAATLAATLIAAITTAIALPPLARCSRVAHHLSHVVGGVCVCVCVRVRESERERGRERERERERLIF